MPTALQVGLVPGFALQDGDRIAQLLGGGGAGMGGGFGLGNTANANVDLTGSSNNNITGATQVIASVTVLLTVTLTGNSLQLVPVPISAMLRIYNASANPAFIFPPTGMSVDMSLIGAPAPINTAVELSGGDRADFLYLGNNQWITDLLGSAVG